MEVLNALVYFTLGFIVGGSATLATCWKIMQKLSKDARDANKDPLIIRIYKHD